jgi:hypothetical protein
MSYEEKYLKYKKKYLNLKAGNLEQLGGGGENKYIVILLSKNASDGQLGNMAKISATETTNKDGFVTEKYEFKTGKFKEINSIFPYIEFTKDEAKKKLSSEVIFNESKDKEYNEIKTICDNNKDKITNLLNTDANNTEPYLYTCLNLANSNDFRGQVTLTTQSNKLKDIMTSELSDYYFLFMAVIINTWPTADYMVHKLTNNDTKQNVKAPKKTICGNSHVC